MREIIHRYDNCLLCNSKLIIHYYNGYNATGTFERKDDIYIITYSNKSKIHKAKFDLQFNVIENDGFPRTFFLIKHCNKCCRTDFTQHPYFSLDKMKDPCMFYIFFIKNNKITLLEELIKFSEDKTSYGWHAKYNCKNNIWNSNVIMMNEMSTIDNILNIHTEIQDNQPFKDKKDLQEKILIYQTFS